LLSGPIGRKDNGRCTSRYRPAAGSEFSRTADPRRMQDRSRIPPLMSALELLPGERRILAKAANAVIRLDEYQLSRLPNDQLMGMIGFAGQEAVGGKVHLTNFRILFESHRVNRVTGAFSVFLPTIREMNDRSRLLVKRLEVVTRLQRFDFVMWGVPAFVEAVRTQSAALTASERGQLGEMATQTDARFGGLERNPTFLKDAAGFAFALVKVAQDPLELSNLLNVAELLTAGDAAD
jgi:hypothetical protein